MEQTHMPNTRPWLTQAESSDSAYGITDIDLMNACSVTDCTGLIPRLPNTQQELDAYKEIVDYEPRAAQKKQP